MRNMESYFSREEEPQPEIETQEGSADQEERIIPFTVADIEEWHAKHGIEFAPLTERQKRAMEKDREAIQRRLVREQRAMAARQEVLPAEREGLRGVMDLARQKLRSFVETFQYEKNPTKEQVIASLGGLLVVGLNGGFGQFSMSSDEKRGVHEGGMIDLDQIAEVTGEIEQIVSQYPEEEQEQIRKKWKDIAELHGIGVIEWVAEEEIETSDASSAMGEGIDMIEEGQKPQWLQELRENEENNVETIIVGNMETEISFPKEFRAGEEAMIDMKTVLKDFQEGQGAQMRVKMIGGDIFLTDNIDGFLGGQGMIAINNTEELNEIGFMPSAEFESVRMEIEIETAQGEKEVWAQEVPIEGSNENAVKPEFMEISAGETNAIVSLPGSLEAEKETPLFLSIAGTEGSKVQAILSIPSGVLVSGGWGFEGYTGQASVVTEFSQDGIRGGSLSLHPSEGEKEARFSLRIITIDKEGNVFENEREWTLPIAAPEK